jgi:hypothetical protein
MEQSESILTEDEKKYLRKVSRYIQSYGITYAEIRLLELNDYPGFDESDIYFDNITHLSNNYSVEIPEGLKPILKKMVEAGMVKMNSLDFPAVDYINYGAVDVDIDCKNNQIRLVYFHTYYDKGGEDSIDFSVEDEDISQELFNQINENVTDVEPIMEIRYNGSGDSGYVEDRFENGASVPAGVQDWCERALSSNFGGWENNEGSDGQFLFNMEKNTVELNHTYNVDEQFTATLYEEKFDK